MRLRAEIRQSKKLVRNLILLVRQSKVFNKVIWHPKTFDKHHACSIHGKRIYFPRHEMIRITTNLLRHANLLRSFVIESKEGKQRENFQYLVNSQYLKTFPYSLRQRISALLFHVFGGIYRLGEVGEN